MTDIIQELRGLIAKATPGPWDGLPSDDYVIVADAYPDKYGGIFQSDDTGPYLAVFGNRPNDYGEANRDLVVAAINHLPALLDRLEAAERDTARLDFLDTCNARLNDRYGTSYKWKLILNHNVNRLMLEDMNVDLADMDVNGKASCRGAIDEEIARIDSHRAAIREVKP